MSRQLEGRERELTRTVDTLKRTNKKLLKENTRRKGSGKGGKGKGKGKGKGRGKGKGKHRK